MRVVSVLASGDLTTKQIQRLLPDVPQASLYRAVSRLLDAGMVTVVDEIQRGGAMERVYSLKSVESLGVAESNPEAILAAIQAVCAALATDASAWAGGELNAQSTLVRRERVLLSPDQLSALTSSLSAVVDGAVAAADPNGAIGASLSLVVLPLPARAEGAAQTD